MMGAGEILLMNQLMSSNRSTYSGVDNRSTSVSAKKQLYKKTKDMFLQLNEVMMNGSAKSISINFGYVERFKTIKFQSTEFKGGKLEEIGSGFDATQLTMMNGDTINVHEPADKINYMLSK